MVMIVTVVWQRGVDIFVLLNGMQSSPQSYCNLINAQHQNNAETDQYICQWVVGIYCGKIFICVHK